MTLNKAESKVQAGADFACVIVFIVPILYCCAMWVVT